MAGSANHTIGRISFNSVYLPGLESAFSSAHISVANSKNESLNEPKIVFETNDQMSDDMYNTCHCPFPMIPIEQISLEVASNSQTFAFNFR